MKAFHKKKAYNKRAKLLSIVAGFSPFALIKRKSNIKKYNLTNDDKYFRYFKAKQNISAIS